MGKVVIIGASKGIGAELSYVYAKDKRELILVGRDILNLEMVKSRCEQMGSTAEIFICDLENDSSLYSLICFLKIQAIEIFIYNAGYAKIGKFLNISEKDILSQIKVNSVIPTLLTKNLGETFINCKSSLAYIGSIASYFSAPGASIYFSSKNYIKAFVLGVYEEFKESGINITLISPGFVDTDMIKNNIKNRKLPNFLVSNPQEVALKIKKAIFKKKRTITIGKLNFIFTLFSKILFGGFFEKIFYKIIKKMIGEVNV